MLVLLSYEVRSAGRSKAAIPALPYPAGRAPGTGRPACPWTARGIRAAVMAGDRLAGSSWRSAPGTALLLTIVSHHYWRPCGRPRPGPRPGQGAVSGRRRTTAPRRLLPSSGRLVPMISGVPNGHARDRRQRPVCPAAREVRGGGTAVGVTFHLMSGHRVAGSDRPPLVAWPRGAIKRQCSTPASTSTRSFHALAAGTATSLHLAAGALRKGISVLGAGDFTHPAWQDELKSTLVPAEAGLCTRRSGLAAPAARSRKEPAPAGAGCL